MSPQQAAPKDGRTYRIVGYIRVSKDELWSGSKTLETQEARIREYLDKCYGQGCYDLRLFRDDGVSGASGLEPTPTQPKTRPSLIEIKALLNSKAYDALIVYDLSRLCRDVQIFLSIYHGAVASSQTRFHSVQEDYDYETPQGMGFAIMQSMHNGMERQGIVRRTRDAALRRAQLGYLHGQAGFGWTWQPGSEVAFGARRDIVPVPEQGQWVRHVKDRYLAGWSMVRIVRELNERGVSSPSGKTMWAVSVLRRVLFNPLHAGLVPVKGGEPIKGRHWEERLFDPEVRDRLLEETKQRKRFATNTLKADQYLLNGLAFCHSCGKRLHPYKRSAGKSAQYFCNNGINQGAFTCPGTRIDEPILEELVLGQVWHQAQQPQAQHQLRAQAERAFQEQDATLLAEQAQLRQELCDLET